MDIRIETNCASERCPPEILNQLSTTIARVIEKPERHVTVTLHSYVRRLGRPQDESPYVRVTCQHQSWHATDELEHQEQILTTFFGSLFGSLFGDCLTVKFELLPRTSRCWNWFKAIALCVICLFLWHNPHSML